MAKRTGFFLDMENFAPIEGMDDAQLGQLLRAMFLWHKGEEATFSDPLAALAFKFFRVAFERDIQAREALAAKRREAANRRWEKKTTALEQGRSQEQEPLPESAAASDADPSPAAAPVAVAASAPVPAHVPVPVAVTAAKDVPAREAGETRVTPFAAAQRTTAQRTTEQHTNAQRRDTLPPVTRLPRDPDPGDPALADMEFQQVLDAYPEGHTAPSGEAALLWKHLKMQGKLPGLPRMLQAIADWSASEEWTRDNGQYIPKLANFLRHHWWTDKPRPVLTGEEMIQAEARRIAASLG